MATDDPPYGKVGVPVDAAQARRSTRIKIDAIFEEARRLRGNGNKTVLAIDRWSDEDEETRRVKAHNHCEYLKRRSGEFLTEEDEELGLRWDIWQKVGVVYVELVNDE